MSISDERARRWKLWETLKQEGLCDLEPRKLRELGVYGGAQGIWVNKERTQHLTSDRTGVTARGYHRVLRVARTLADLDGSEGVRRIHVSEALSYRRMAPGR